MRWIERQWQRDTIASRLLLPMSWLYGALAATRRLAYRRQLCRSVRLPVPVVVVGNITVGGTGKTPLVIWLGERLTALGWRPGIVTRGYGGRARRWPQAVTADSDPNDVGDEPVLLARRTRLPVMADPERARGARQLVAQGCDIVISDDGLQHYRLARDLEIAVIDGERRFGNSRLLPAGPLREPLERLEQVDARVVQGAASPAEWSLTLAPLAFRRVNAPELSRPLDGFRGRTVHAVAAIGHPPRFFASLRALGLQLLEHGFNDHHVFVPSDLGFDPAYDIVMTEKDAVKCRRFAGDHVWYLEVEARVDQRLEQWLQETTRKLRRG